MILRLAERRARRAARRCWMACRGAALALSRPIRPAPGPIREQDIRRVLAVRLDRLGDLVLTLPAIDALAVSRPMADLFVAVRAPLGGLLEGRPGLNRVLEVERDEPVEVLADRLRSLGVDLAVCFSSPDDLTAARALAAAGIRYRVGLCGGGHETFMTHPVMPPGEPLPLPALNALVVRAAGGRADAARPSLCLSGEEHGMAERLLQGLGVPAGGLRIAVHTGSFHPSQRWPSEHFVEAASSLAARRGGSVIVLASPGEEAAAGRLGRLMPSGTIVVPPFSVRIFAAILGRCDLLLANNSGPLHLAGAVGLPAVSVMGPTDPARFWPQGSDQAVLRRASLACSPCTRGRCGPHDCLKGIPPGEVVDAAVALVDRLSAAGRIGFLRRAGAAREHREEVALEPAGAV